MFENSVTYQFIANVDSGMDGSAETITPNDLPEGGVGVFTLNGNSVAHDAALNADTLVRIVGRKNGALNFSPPFTRNTLTWDEGNQYEDPVEQITYVGYDGSDGSLDLLTNTSYVLGLRLNHTQGIYNNTPMVKSVPFWLAHVSDAENARDTQLRLARGLMESFIKQFSRDAANSIVCERAATASAANITTSSMLKVTKGSTEVTGHTCTDGDNINDADIDTVSDGDTIFIPASDSVRTFTITIAQTDEDTLILIGDKQMRLTTTSNNVNISATECAAAINNAFPNGEVRASSTGSSGVVTITYGENFKALPPVIADDTTDAPYATVVTAGDRTKVAYVVSSGAGTNTIQLDVPWQGESGYVRAVAHANHGDAFHTAAADVTNWGLRLVGNTPLTYDPKLGPPHQVSFDVSFSRVLNRSDREDGVSPTADAEIEKDVAANPGAGTYKQVSYAEIWKTMNEGNSVVSHYPPTKYSETAKLNQEYGRIYLSGVDASYTSTGTGQNPVSKFNIAIAVKEDLTRSYDGFNTIFGITMT